MYCAPLLEITELNDIQRNTFDSFFSQFLNNGYTTVSKAIHLTGMNELLIINTFDKLCSIGFLEKIYAVRCPECDHFIKKIENIENFDFKSIDFCYACDKQIEIDEKDVYILYVRKNCIPFGDGQHPVFDYEILLDGDVAQIDTLACMRNISESLTIMATTFSYSAEEDRRKKKYNKIIEENTYKRYKENTKKANGIILFFRLVFLGVMVCVAWSAGLDKNISSFISICTYALFNIIEFVVNHFIETDYSKIRIEEQKMVNKNIVTGEA